MGIFTFLNTFSRTHNTPRTSREKNSNDFLKGRTSHSELLAIFPRNKGKHNRVYENPV